MRRAFNALAIAGDVVIGRASATRRPCSSSARRSGGPGRAPIEIAVDPLEGTTSAPPARRTPSASSPWARRGSSSTPPTRTWRRSPSAPARGVVDLAVRGRKPPAIADALGRYVEDLTVVILDRPRHEQLIREVREAGARVKLIADGDVRPPSTPACPTRAWTCSWDGGAPEGVLGAAALRCMGGDIRAGYLPERRRRERARAMGMVDLDQSSAEELAEGDVMFAATGVTDGDFLKGVRFKGGGARTHSVVMRSKTGTIRFIETDHHFAARRRLVDSPPPPPARTGKRHGRHGEGADCHRRPD